MSMAMEFVRKMPLPQEIKRDYPADGQIKTLKEERNREISDILTGKDSRILLIIGPCSADREDAVLSFPGSIQTNPAPKVWGTRGCFISRILKRRKIWWQGLSRSASCICG